MESVKIRNKDMYWDIAADIYFPANFDKTQKYPAIISAHPIGSCKEQTSGNVYGVALAKEGFVVIAFDRSFQGLRRAQASGCRLAAFSFMLQLRLRHLPVIDARHGDRVRV